MTFLSEFSYSEISQRRIVLLNSLISFIILGFIYIDASIALNYYFIYQPVLQIVFLAALTGIFIGNVTGKLAFTKFAKHRLMYASAEVLFLLSCSFYIYSKLLIRGDDNPLLYLFFKSPYYVVLPLFVISLFAGIKINYFLKIACGNFIDNKKAVMQFLLFLFIGMALGIVLSIFLYYYKGLYYYSGVLLLCILPTIFLIKLSYNPAPIYAQEVKKNNDASADTGENHKRDDLFFIYLNFTYILIYLFLGFTSIVKYLGDFLYIKILYILISFISLGLGFIFARIAKQVFWYIYAEMLYPVFFIISLVSLIYLKDDISFLTAICIFIPVSILLSFSLFQTISLILASNNHKNRFSILDFSMFILPAPILISLNFIDFTYFWYFVLLYMVALMNIFIPGIYLMQTKIKGYKKALFYIAALIFIPLLILMHMYFNIPLNSNFYITRTTGFDSLNYINYNSDYINNEAAVYIHGIKSFYADDPAVRNMKRAIVPAMLYAENNNWSEVLFMDGNRKFFKNPAISLLKNVHYLDYVPDRMTDLNMLSISGDQNYILEQSDILFYLRKRKSPLKMIIDVPSLFDQTLNAFRFSKEYYSIINNYLSPEGIFVQILSLNCREDFISGAAESLKGSFKKTIGYYFPNYLVLMSSNSDKALKIGLNNINNFKELAAKTGLKNLFYNEFHLLSHILFLDIDDFLVYSGKKEIDPFYFLYNQKKFRIDKNLIAGYSDNNSSFLDLIDKNNPNIYFFNTMQYQVAVNKFFLSEVKKAELYEANYEYESEAAQLINLRRQSEYLPELRGYISNILSYKEDYYYNAALRFEKEKKWEEARKLYRAILTINRNNFEANYRLGILSIILQDINSSFEYLQYAMQLKKDNPKVFYQMGVLLFSSGRPGEALVYLERAVELKEKTAYLYYYMGLCYEELGNLSAAANYYNQAIILDPNDKNIISSIERIKEKNNIKRNESRPDEQSSHSEVEQGEDMPLPVSEGAINIRIEEDKSASARSKKEEKK